ncbi:MAG TPA: hypothetical protein VNI02_13655 [Blastocatellia bacterium]|jgi:hypothetical protein|nr:hypothetical protein [Blastocatellia bacterium]
MARSNTGTEGRDGAVEEAAVDTTLESDKSLRIGSSHGEATDADEATGYARDIAPEGRAVEAGRESRKRGSGLSGEAKGHPSRNLQSRSRGFGIGGGYERPYRKERPKTSDNDEGLYGPLPPAGYYGAGTSERPFKRGQAGFADELPWYRAQYGEKTSGYDKTKKRK